MIDPTAYLAPGSVVLGDVHLGPRVSVWFHTVVRGDAETITVGEDTNLQDLTMLHADPGIPCTIGKRVTVGHRVILHGCTVEDDCLIGMGAIVLNRAHIGTGSIIGAGAVVGEGVQIPPGSVVLGVPAKVVRQVDDGLRQRIEFGWRHYVERMEQHRQGDYPLLAAPTGEVAGA